MYMLCFWKSVSFILRKNIQECRLINKIYVFLVKSCANRKCCPGGHPHTQLSLMHAH